MMLQQTTATTPNPIQFASPAKKGIKRLHQRVNKAIGKRVKVLFVESVDGYKAGMTASLDTDKAAGYITSFKAKEVR